MTIQRYIMISITVIALAMIAIANGRPAINCQDPQVWSTANGVQHCAINQGE